MDASKFSFPTVLESRVGRFGVYYRKHGGYEQNRRRGGKVSRSNCVVQSVGSFS